MNAKSIGSSAALVLALAAPHAWAQDPAVVAPDIYKCTFENEFTRVCEITFAPGAKIAAHSHPGHLIYVLQPGKMRITDAGSGEVAQAEFAAGQSVWMPAVTHHGENVGNTEIKGIVVEFKNHKDAPMAKGQTGTE